MLAHGHSSVTLRSTSKPAMARSTEKIALKLLKAFAAEQQRQPDLLKCRTAGDLAEHICSSQEEFDRVMEFLSRQKGLINAVRRPEGGLAVQPNEQGHAWIAGQKEKWNLSTRLSLYALLLSIVIYGVPKILAWLLR